MSHDLGNIEDDIQTMGEALKDANDAILQELTTNTFKTDDSLKGKGLPSVQQCLDAYHALPENHPVRKKYPNMVDRVQILVDGGYDMTNNSAELFEAAFVIPMIAEQKRQDPFGDLFSEKNAG